VAARGRLLERLDGFRAVSHAPMQARPPKEEVALVLSQRLGLFVNQRQRLRVRLAVVEGKHLAAQFLELSVLHAEPLLARRTSSDPLRSTLEHPSGEILGTRAPRRDGS